MSRSMRNEPVCVGVRREDKSSWERRAPIVPQDAAELRTQHGITLCVQPSPNRVYPEYTYLEAGATVDESLAACPVIFGVKEIPTKHLERGKTYVFFSHVIKGQPHNMPMLRRLMELGCNLIDYERVIDEQGRRLIFFGRYAGIAGMLETLWALGKRLEWEGFPNPLAYLCHAYEYHDLAEARQSVLQVAEAIRREGLPHLVAPLIVGVIGYGNVARGVWEILNLLPIRVLEPNEVLRFGSNNFGRSSIYVATFREEHTIAPMAEGHDFDLQEYYAHPEGYRAVFEQYVPFLTTIVNAVYWDARYPRLVTKAYLRRLFGAESRAFCGAESAGKERGTSGVPCGEDKPCLRVIGDISCDIDGSIECTVQATEPHNPVYVYNPLTGEPTVGYAGTGVVVMAVDILPSELPRDASAEFSRILRPYVPAIAEADYSLPFDQLDLPAEIKRAMILHHGQLTPGYRHLAEFLNRNP